MAFGRTFLRLFDRTAALTLGIVAGFAIGLSFRSAGPSEPSGGVDRPAPARTAPALATHSAPVAAEPPVDPRVAGRVRDRGSVTVGVFGDSFGDGVWAALYHQLPARSHFRVLRFSKEGTGFTRYRQVDLEQRAKAQLADDPVDVAVICFGANDVQPIFADGHLRALLDPGWRKVVGDRIVRFVARARSTGAQVYWLGLPVMRDRTMDDDIVAMDAFYRHTMDQLAVPFIDTRAVSLGAQGGYSAYLSDDRTGEARLMRANDGVHMSPLGYQRLTATLAARIRAYAARIPGDHGTASAPAARPVPMPTPAVPQPSRPAEPALRPPTDTPLSEPARLTPPEPELQARSARRPRPSPAGEASQEQLDADLRALDREARAPEPAIGIARPTADGDGDGEADARATARANRREKKRQESASPAVPPPHGKP